MIKANIALHCKIDTSLQRIMYHYKYIVMLLVSLWMGTWIHICNIYATYMQHICNIYTYIHIYATLTRATSIFRPNISSYDTKRQRNK